MFTRFLVSFLATLSLLSVSGLASAHAGSDPLGGSLLGGLLHPILGLDHLIALVAIGIWMAFQRQSVRRIVLPVVLLGLFVGALAGLGGVHVPGAEVAIVASVIVVGLLITLRHRLPAWGAGLMTGGFMLFHGAAHGAEMQAGSDAAAYVVGLVVASALLISVSQLAASRPQQIDLPVSRILGIGVMFAGGLFAAV